MPEKHKIRIARAFPPAFFRKANKKIHSRFTVRMIKDMRSLPSPVGTYPNFHSTVGH